MTAVQRVQQLADERNLTLYQVSTLCDIPYSTLKSTIRRGGDISIETAAMVCRGLKIPAATFFSYLDQQQ